MIKSSISSNKELPLKLPFKKKKKEVNSISKKLLKEEDVENHIPNYYC